jgi:hypothetical protein
MSDIKLRIMDELLASGVNISGTGDFTVKLNNKLPPGERPIQSSQTKNLIRELRELAEDKGFKLIHDKKRGYRYSSPIGSVRVFDDLLGEDDKTTLRLAIGLFSILNGSGINEQFSLVVDKVLNNRGIKMNSHSTPLHTHIQIGPTFNDPGAKWLSALINAMKEADYALEVQYWKPETGVTQRILSPYIVKQYALEWYLVAYDHHTKHKDKTKLFKLERIRRIESSAEPFIKDPKFSADEYFRFTIGIQHRHLEESEVTRLQINDDNLFDKLNKMPLHSTQIIEDPTKKILSIETYDTNELDELILKHGPAIKVLSPQKIADRIKEKLNQTISMYS